MRRLLFTLALLLLADSAKGQNANGLADLRTDPERLIAPLIINEPIEDDELDLVDATGKKKPKPKPDCLDGVKYDDGKLENGLRPVAFEDNFVMLFEAPSYPAKLEKICIAWRKTSLWNDIWFDVRIWKADGPNGAPGAPVDVIPTLHAAKIPPKGKFYTYDVSGYGIIIEGPVYIGPFWDPLDHFLVYLSMDEGPKTPRRRGFVNVGILDDHPPSSELGLTIDRAPSYRAFGIRAKFGPL